MTRANFRDQQLQTVLVAMGISIGKAGIDGVAGQDTNKAIRMGAEKINNEMAGSTTRAQTTQTVSQGDVGTKASMEKLLLDKLKDPKFRQEALDKLAKEPQTENSIKATNVILHAAGFPIRRDLVSGLVSGKIDDSTRVALANTENGKPTSQYMANTVAQATGLKTEEVAGLFPNAPDMRNHFAASSVACIPAEPKAAVVVQRKPEFDPAPS
jgi:hypothetical protein